MAGKFIRLKLFIVVSPWFSEAQLAGAVRLSSSVIEVPKETKKGDVLFLHGLFGQGNNFRSIARKISEATFLSAHLIDLRNHGSSPHSAMTPSLLVSDILLYLKERSLKSVNIIGHSLGGRVAMQLALSKMGEELLDKLIVVDVGKDLL